MEVAEKTMEIVKMGASDKFITKGLNLIARILHEGEKKTKSIIELLLKKYSKTLSNNLLYQSTNVKLKVL